MGSPLNSTSTKESLKELGLKMKKNGVAIDLIDFGTENRGNTEILSELIGAVDSEAHPSRLVTVESEGSNGGIFLLDALKSKVPEMFNRSGNNGADGTENGFDFDPEMDPELAMALKLSMEEEVNRQRKSANDEEDDDDEKYVDVEDDDDEDMMDNEDEELARAIALSMEQEKKDQKQ